MRWLVLFRRLPGAMIVLALIFAGSAAAQQEDPPGRPTRPPIDPELTMVTGPTGTIVVRLGLATGVSMAFPAEVRLFSHMGFQQTSARSLTGEQVIFRSVPTGEYSVEVRAPGFATSRNEAILWKPGTVTYVFINLHPESSNYVTGAGGLPLLAPKARKEAEKGLEALRAGNLAEAQKRLEKALKLAPGHPLVNYVAGLVYFRLSNLARARALLEKAASLNPDFVPGQEALGVVLSGMGEHLKAIAALEHALVIDPNRSEAHARIAAAFYQQREWEKARAHAARARELSKGEAPDAHFLLGLALARLGQREAAIRELEAFLVKFPAYEAAPRARKVLERLRAGRPAQEAGGLPADAEPEPASAQPPMFAGMKLPEPRWAPPDVDEAVPPVSGEVPCSLPDVLRGAGLRVKLLAQNLEAIGATERVEYAQPDATGTARSAGVASFNYVVSIREPRPGHLSVEESRELVPGSETLPSPLFAKGLAAVAMVFHPYYVNDFEMTCEGLGQWRGEPAWQVHFRQRPDQPSRILRYQAERGSYPVNQKGRAWIAANSYQILRLEADLVEPIREIALQRQHLAIDYRTVEFRQRQVELWLPAAAELHVLVRGRRFRHQHAFSDFVLFSVDTKQRIHEPPQN